MSKGNLSGIIGQHSPLVTLVRCGRPVMMLLFYSHGVPLLCLPVVPPTVVEVGSRVLNELQKG
jgi:hypothetical protein